MSTVRRHHSIRAVCENYIHLVRFHGPQVVTDHLTLTAPIIEAGVIDQYSTVYFNGTINFEEKWAGTPNDARDKLWKDMTYGRSDTTIFPPSLAL